MDDEWEPMELSEHEAAVVFREDGSIHLLIPKGHPSKRLSFEQNAPTARALSIATLFDDSNPESNELRDRLAAAIELETMLDEADQTIH